MLKISRAYLDACGYVDGVFEELLIKPTDLDAAPLHHLIHAPNGVGKTTILALLFSIFEPDRRKFLRTEINRQHECRYRPPVRSLPKCYSLRRHDALSLSPEVGHMRRREFITLLGSAAAAREITGNRRF